MCNENPRITYKIVYGPVAMFMLLAASILVLRVVPMLLALPCEDGADSLASIAQSITHRGSLPSMALCMEDTEFLHMIQDSAHVLQRHINVPPRVNSSDKTISNATSPMMLHQRTKFLAKDIYLNWQEACKVYSNMSPHKKVPIVIFIVLAIIATCIAFVLIMEQSQASNIPSPATISVRQKPWTASPNKSESKSSKFSEGPIENSPSPSPESQEKELSMNSLPVLCPQLLQSKPITLAVPIQPFSFTVDAFSTPDMPLLTASLPGGLSNVLITLSRTGAPLAMVTPSCHILTPDEQHVGTLSPNNLGQYILHDADGQNIMLVEPGDKFQEVRMSMRRQGSIIELAVVLRQSEREEFSMEHYSLTIMSGIDSVLIFACFLALILFALPAYSKQTSSPQAGSPLAIEGLASIANAL